MVYPGIPVDNSVLCKSLRIKPESRPISDKAGPLVTGRITEHGFGLSTVLLHDEMNLQQAEKSGIQQDIACMKFGRAATVEVTHNSYKPMTSAVEKGYLSI